MKVWADHSLGTLGRTGDYLNSCLMALSEAGPWFAQADPAFGENVRALLRAGARGGPAAHAHADHAAGQPQPGAAQQLGGPLTARIVREDDNGDRDPRRAPARDDRAVRRRAARVPLDPAQGHGRRTRPTRSRSRSPATRPGLRFICRESFDYGRGHFDHPLGSRFEEMDAVVVFDDVHVPFERCFMLGHPELCNGIYTETGAAAHMTHQVATRTTRQDRVRSSASSRCSPRRSASSSSSTCRRTIAEVIIALETCAASPRRRGRRRAQRVRRDDAALGAAQRVRATGTREAYQRFPEILRKLGASGLMALPTEADVDGPGARRHRALPQSRHARRPGPRPAVPAGLGHVHLGVRRAPGALRVLLLRRPGADGRRAGAELRPRALPRARARVPRARRRRLRIGESA